ncbi:hypothetical protein X802_06725 [Thermococcus guaymasensis DSM 11113]|uniref:Uncharacterized protein n=1 Tax=Thermococcus guaymasensis DSM 11113 TaxID=1432656 RepID=A0A0X1KN84_9EURY|nr:hypothetical protein [Thermococcus guaymasensis]AJC72752.1 hypothetical protein X802_06725 [Thermococcus guaymasensis DSM 11113]
MIEERIPYHDEKAWEEYIAQLSHLYVKIEGVLRLRDWLLEEAGDRTVDALLKENKIWEKVLFGGLNEDGIAKNGLARFYSEILGFGITREDMERIVSYLKEGIDLESASSGVKPKLVRTNFTDLLRSMRENLVEIFDELGRKPPTVGEISLSSPMTGPQVVGELLSAAKELLPLFNPMSCFIVSICSTPRFYLEKSYSKLFTEDVQELLRQYGIVLEDVILPDLPLERERKRRAVVGLKPGTVGHRIYKVILDCYRLFQIWELGNFFGVEDEFEKYLKVYSERLKDTIPLDELRNVYRAITSSYSYNDDFNSLRVPDPFRVYKRNATINGGKLKFESGPQNGVNYTEFIAFIAPLAFCGFAVLEGQDNKINCQVIMGWES